EKRAEDVDEDRGFERLLDADPAVAEIGGDHVEFEIALQTLADQRIRCAATRATMQRAASDGACDSADLGPQHLRRFFAERPAPVGLGLDPLDRAAEPDEARVVILLAHRELFVPELLAGLSQLLPDRICEQRLADVEDPQPAVAPSSLVYGRSHRH